VGLTQPVPGPSAAPSTQPVPASAGPLEGLPGCPAPDAAASAPHTRFSPEAPYTPGGWGSAGVGAVTAPLHPHLPPGVLAENLSGLVAAAMLFHPNSHVAAAGPHPFNALYHNLPSNHGQLPAGVFAPASGAGAPTVTAVSSPMATGLPVFALSPAGPAALNAAAGVGGKPFAVGPALYPSDAMFGDLAGNNPNNLGPSASMNNLAIALRSKGEYKQEAEMHREALEIRKRVLPADHPDIATSTDNLAIALGSEDEATLLARTSGCDADGRLSLRHLSPGKAGVQAGAQFRLLASEGTGASGPVPIMPGALGSLEVGAHAHAHIQVHTHAHADMQTRSHADC
jgi:hypothetical protein